MPIKLNVAHLWKVEARDGVRNACLATTAATNKRQHGSWRDLSREVLQRRLMWSQWVSHSDVVELKMASSLGGSQSVIFRLPEGRRAIKKLNNF
jgi:hypothetical protein